MEVDFKEPYYDKALNKVFRSKSEKERHLKEHGIVHDGSMENDRKRDDRLAEIINEERNKQGLKSKTLQELAGDAKKVKSRTVYFC